MHCRTHHITHLKLINGAYTYRIQAQAKQMLNIKLPTNENEFSEMMESVDLFLREIGTSPHSRPIKGWFEISKALGLGLRMFPDGKMAPEEGVYTGDDLTLRIFEWFDKRYCKKLNKKMGPGRMSLLVRDDPRELNFPKVWGTVKFFISPGQESSNQEEDLKYARIPSLNILDLITNLPLGLARSLSNTEQARIALIFRNSYDAMLALDEIKKAPMIFEIQSDIDAAANHLSTTHPTMDFLNGHLYKPLRKPSRHI